MKLSEKDAKMLNSIVAELRAGNKIVYRPLSVCRRLDILEGRPEPRESWSKMRAEFKYKYPLEEYALRLWLDRIRARLKEGKE